MYFYTEPNLREKLYPLSDHIPVEKFWLGTSTIQEKWEKALATLSNPFIQENNLGISAVFLPNQEILNQLQDLKTSSIITSNNRPIAWVQLDKEKTLKIPIQSPCESIEFPEDLISLQEKYLACELASLKPQTEKFKEDNQIFHPESIYIHPSVSMKGAILDASQGPIYIAEGVKINIGSLIKGPTYIGKNSTLSMGAKIRPFTTLSENCTVGGEVSFSIFHPHTNKSHEGFIGHSIIGSFCNFGAATNCSNLKNTIGSIQIQSVKKRDSKKMKLGIITGSFIATGIGTSLNSGICIGSHCNIYGSNLFNQHIPRFSWGEADQLTTYQLEKCLIHVKNWLKLRNLTSFKDLEIRIEELWTTKNK